MSKELVLIDITKDLSTEELRKLKKQITEELSKRHKAKESEFHCGVEESGGHAYNCNDCPNKCDEWYRWDKEMKNDRSKAEGRND